MANVKRFEDLDCYKLAVKLTAKVYLLFKKPQLKNEYEFKSQMLAALISITNNIAEGFEYENNVDFIRFLRYAKGSSGEVRNILNNFKRCELITVKEYSELYKGFITLSKQINGLRKYLIDYEKKKQKTKS